ncbi:uncharacterized protein LOC112195949 isoform X2 [Rosa chinensis]|uniref:uncharacterized protein LOC112195949 isoform X2 n=1 Tax=Rosa chinensis TaxID=74649 RepID=UPI001AD90236|nr:uncharacterized protein LOC112195949 isoform X2 [Rosa chinensis]
MWHMFSQPRLQRLFPKEMERMFQLMLKRSKIRGPLLPGEFLCRTYILNALDDSLYDIFSSFKTARELWESLDNKYKTEVACSKKFVIGKFLNYKMVNAKSVFKQVEELQVIVHELDEEEVKGLMLLLWSQLLTWLEGVHQRPSFRKTRARMMLPNQLLLLLQRSHSPHKRTRPSKSHKLEVVGCAANQGIEQKSVASRKIKEVEVLEVPTT